MFIAYMHEAN